MATGDSAALRIVVEREGARYDLRDSHSWEKTGAEDRSSSGWITTNMSRNSTSLSMSTSKMSPEIKIGSKETHWVTEAGIQCIQRDAGHKGAHEGSEGESTWWSNDGHRTKDLLRITGKETGDRNKTRHQQQQKQGAATTESRTDKHQQWAGSFITQNQQ